jgi:hypothetical protein
MNHATFASVPPNLACQPSMAQRAGSGFAEDMLVEAFEFVSLCNAVTTPRVGVLEDDNGRRLEFLRGELHAKQEAAFVKACEYIGQRFAEATKELMAAHG